MIKLENTVSATILCSLLLLLFSCTKDFIVKDIKNDLVNVIAPIDNLSSPNNTITFWWDELDGAEKYNLQIVKPNFNSVTQLILDTNITTTKFYKTLAPGTYQWRIKAINNGGSTAYVTRNLIIDTTSNLSLVSVNLTTPLNYSVMANNSITFSWNTLYAATSYELKLTNLATSSVTTISSIVGSSYTYSFSTVSGTEDKYSWQIKAFNSFSQTLTNITRSFKIDYKAPFASSILSPNTYSITLRDTTYLKWNRNVSNTDIYYDILYISADSTFASFIDSQRVNSVLQTRINSMYTYPGTAIPLWWRVNSVDSVGNISVPIQSKRFYLY
jgi:hypothetical protein